MLFAHYSYEALEQGKQDSKYMWTVVQTKVDET